MEKWLRLKEAAEVCGIDYEVFRKRILRYRDRLRLRKLRRSGGGYVVEVALSSLEEMGWVRVEVSGGLGGDFEKDCYDAVIEGRVKEVAERYGVSERTVYRVAKRFKSSRGIERRGGLRSFEDRAILLAYSFYLKGYSKRRIYDELKGLGLRVGSYEQLVRHLKEFEERNRDLSVYAREGEKRYKDLCELPIYRDWSKLEPMEVVVGDQYQFDVVVEWFDGSLVRPWLSAWMDGRTRKVLGWTISVTPDGRSVVDSLRKVIVRYGVPVFIYVDNGKTYRTKRMFRDEEVKEYRMDLDGEVISLIERCGVSVIGDREVEKVYDSLASGMVVALDIRVIRAGIYNARGKIIERFFRNISQWCRELVGWTGRNYTECPEETKERMKAFKKGKLYRGEKPLMHIGELMLKFSQFLDVYHRTYHRSLGMSPEEAWGGYECGRRVSDERLLDVLIMNSAERVVRKSHVEFRGEIYANVMLRKVVGKRVVLKWDDSDFEVVERIDRGGSRVIVVPRRVLIFVDGEFYCEAERLRRVVPLREGFMDRLDEQRKIMRLVRGEVREIENFQKMVEEGKVRDEADVVEYLKRRQSEQERRKRERKVEDDIIRITFDEFKEMYNVDDKFFDEGEDEDDIKLEPW